MKIAIIGSRNYGNYKKVLDFISYLLKKYPTDLEIVSGGQKNGVDGFAKKAAPSLGVKYSEFPPAHYNWNQYCVLGPENYGEAYNVANYHIRNAQVVDYADYVIAFVEENYNGTGTRSALNYAKSKGKKSLTFT